jgi:geranylgeranyl diphosphate synthase type I
MDHMKLTAAHTAYLPLIEAEIRDILNAPDPAVAGHYAMLQYHMGWLDETLAPAAAPTGKRIRPLLCVLACGAAGGAPERAVPAGAGLELLHNFSLIHDDIEDDSPTRRHRLTAWKLFGLPLALNAGDGMFSLAHLAFFRLPAQGVSPESTLRILHVFEETCLALTEGQYMDMSFEDRQQVSVDEYFRMIAGKTGALLAAAPEIGALVAGASPEAVSGYRRYGAALGRAFQLRDDILGIWGDEASTGKSAASDILSKKKSLPVLYAMADAAVGDQLRALYAGPDFVPNQAPQVIELLDAAGARDYVDAQVQAASAVAAQTLDALESSANPEYLETLRELLAALARRST